MAEKKNLLGSFSVFSVDLPFSPQFPVKILETRFYSSCLPFLSEITITGSKERQTLPAEINPDYSTSFRKGTNTKSLTSELVGKVIREGIGEATQRSQNSIFVYRLASILLRTADLTCPTLIDRIN